MQERRAKEIDWRANYLDRLEQAEAGLREAKKQIAELSGRPNGKTDEEIIGILYKEVGKGTVSFLAKLFLYTCGILGTVALTWLGIKGYSKTP